MMISAMMIILVMVLMLIVLIVAIVFVVVVVSLAMVGVLLMAVAMLAEAINNTRRIAADRGGSQRIFATTKFDVPGGLKGRKRPLLLIASGNYNL